MQGAYIPFHRPSVGADELHAVEQVLASQWLTTGPVTHAFEKEFAAYVGAKHALAVNSCTAALQLALDAIGVGPGDEVLVPTYTFAATAEVVTYFGARPVLCDSVPSGFNIDPKEIERRRTPRTKAVIPVHIAGEPCEMDTLQAAARGLHIIEDAAHALPARYRGRCIGTISPLTCFSFYATKTITTGEGGMLTTDNDQYAERARRMRLHGIAGDAWKRYSGEGSWFYEVQDAGYKLNLPDLLAAIGRAQLQKCNQFQRARTAIAQRYLERLSTVDELEMPPQPEADSEHSWHLFILRFREEASHIYRNDVVEELAHSGIGTSVHFIPLHRHPFYVHRYGYERNEFPNAENAYSRCLSLPIYPDLREEEADRVIRGVEHAVHKYRKTAVAA
jgi:dTDP-4-amino-4,6-dideoxygalactose transaminase